MARAPPAWTLGVANYTRNGIIYIIVPEGASAQEIAHDIWAVLNPSRTHEENPIVIDFAERAQSQVPPAAKTDLTEELRQAIRVKLTAMGHNAKIVDRLDANQLSQLDNPQRVIKVMSGVSWRKGEAQQIASTVERVKKSAARQDQRQAAHPQTVAARVPAALNIHLADASSASVTQLADTLISAAREISRNKHADLRPGFVFACGMNHDFQQAFQEDALSSADAALFGKFMSAVNHRVFMPAGHFLLISIAGRGGLETHFARILPGTWRKVEYLPGIPLWTADIEWIIAERLEVGISFDGYAFVDPVKARTHAVPLYERIIRHTDKRYLLLVTLRSWLQKRKISQEAYVKYLGIERMRQEELHHAKDTLFASLRLGRPSLDLKGSDVVEAILKPGAAMRREYWDDARYGDEGVREQLAHLIGELSGRLSGVIAEMEMHLARGRSDLAYAAFLNCIGLHIQYADDTTTTGSFNKVYVLMAQMLIWSLADAGIESEEDILRFVQRGPGDSAAQALALLKRVYQAHFWTDSERAELLRMSSHGQLRPENSFTGLFARFDRNRQRSRKDLERMKTAALKGFSGRTPVLPASRQGREKVVVFVVDSAPEHMAMVTTTIQSVLCVDLEAAAAVEIRELQYQPDILVQLNNYAVLHPEEVVLVSMSLGLPSPSSRLNGMLFPDLLQEAARKNIVIVVSAQNNNAMRDYFHRYYDNYIVVAAAERNGARWEKASYSNFGVDVSFCVPAPYDKKTSMATPKVTGLLALMLARDRVLSPQEALHMIQGFAEPMRGEAYFEAGLLGAGLLDIEQQAALAVFSELPLARSLSREVALKIAGSALFSEAARTIRNIYPGALGVPGFQEKIIMQLLESGEQEGVRDELEEVLTAEEAPVANEWAWDYDVCACNDNGERDSRVRDFLDSFLWELRDRLPASRIVLLSLLAVVITALVFIAKNDSSFKTEQLLLVVPYAQSIIIALFAAAIVGSVVTTTMLGKNESTYDSEVETRKKIAVAVALLAW
ncbi:MAG: S8 family serine peptidase, partial [Candidatus Omnitrophota bacterium]